MGPHSLELAEWLPNNPLTLAHSVNCCPLQIQSSGPIAAYRQSPASPQAGQFYLGQWPWIGPLGATWGCCMGPHYIIWTQQDSCRKNLLLWPIVWIATPRQYSQAGLQQPVTNHQQALNWANFTLGKWSRIGSSGAQWCYMRLLYGPILFEASRRAAEQTSLIGP